MTSTTTLSLHSALQALETLLEQKTKLELQTLAALADVDRRRAFALKAHPSLWDYLIKARGFSESEASQWINALKVLKDLPELCEDLSNTQHSLGSLSQIESFIRKRRTRYKQQFDRAQRLAIFRQCRSKGSKEIERLLCAFTPSQSTLPQVPKERALSDTQTLVTFVADQALLQKIHRIRDLSAARLPNPYAYPEDIVALMSDVALKALDPLAKKSRANAATVPSQRQRYIPSSVRREVWLQCKSRCSYIDEGGKRCEATYGLEVEHCRPIGEGGDSSAVENLTLLCKRHNQLRAIEHYGEEKMSEFIKTKKPTSF